ncbi:MAG: thermonuclease family protein [Alphaproteobacteria bacterium]|nr:MAG: thermonuclease family protein [Alphaproteobacteria bacterium]
MAEIVRLHRAARLARYRTRAKRGARYGFALLMAGAFVAAAALGGLALPFVMPGLQPQTQGAKVPDIVFLTLPLCQGGKGRDCVIDGDTFRLDGQSIRIADIDTPETRNYACAAEKTLGDRATARMHQLLNAGAFELQPYERDEDQYGRKLRIVTRDGRSLGQILVAEGLARTWDGARHPWC